MFVLETKEPTFENGNYRLNFHGRVTVPSVKNFQLVSPDAPEQLVAQFGKVGDDRFHLDFKAPLTAYQAFCIALSQFNF
jgi:tubby-related protein 1